ncbi:MAG: DUF6273 domain-containing protein [Bacillota bacterium]
MKFIYKNNFYKLIMIFAAVMVLAGTLFIGYTTGLSDNGDFNRVIAPNRISYEEGSREPFVFTSRYKLSIVGKNTFDKIINTLFSLDSKYVTTQNIFIKLSILANLVFNAATGANYGIYNIEWLGAVYCALFSLALGIAFFMFRSGKRWLDICFCILMLFFFCDIGYTAYFNSFYGEALQFLSLIFIFACLIAMIFSRKPSVIYCILYFAGTILFAGSKFANIPVGVLMALAGLSFASLKGIGKSFKVLIAGCFAVSIVSAAYFFINVPRWMDQQTTYQAVFFGILKDSPDAEKDLEWLGLPQYMIELKNTNYYMDHKIDINSTEFQDDFYGKVTKPKVLKYYLANPARLWRKLDISCRNSMHINPKYLGNAGQGRERLTLSKRFGFWSSLRARMPFDNIYFVAALFIYSAFIIFTELKTAFRKEGGEDKRIIACVFYAVLLAATAINFAVPVITNGEADLAKHMFGFINCIDIIFLSALLWTLYKLAGIINIRILLRSLPFIALVIVLAAAALIFTFSSGLRKYEKPEPGSYVNIGSYQGKKLLWRVADINDEGILLISDTPVDCRPFDAQPDAGDANRLKYGSNLWTESSLRSWLNGDFLQGFDTDELQLVNEYHNKILLSKYDLELASSGENDFFWTYVPSMVDFGYDEAFSTYVYDKVFLFDVRQFREHLVDGKLPHARNFQYWLETAYFNNSSMVRVVDTDGTVYMKDAATGNIAVMPAMYIKKDAAVTAGNGSRKNPFVFGLK